MSCCVIGLLPSPLRAQLATPELRANVLAAYVAGGRAREVPAVMAAMKFGPRDSFEIAFNAACALLGAGDAPAAEQQLLLAQRLGAQSKLAWLASLLCHMLYLHAFMPHESPLSGNSCPCWQSASLSTCACFRAGIHSTGRTLMCNSTRCIFSICTSL